MVIFLNERFYNWIAIVIVLLLVHVSGLFELSKHAVASTFLVAEERISADSESFVAMNRQVPDIATVLIAEQPESPHSVEAVEVVPVNPEVPPVEHETFAYTDIETTTLPAQQIFLTYQTTAYYLNVRLSPDSSSTIVNVVEQGTILQVEQKLSNGWLKLADEGGYVHGAYADLMEQESDGTGVNKPATTGNKPMHSPEENKPNKPDSQIESASGLTVEMISSILSGTELADFGLEETILQIEQDYGINAFFTIAVMKLESGNGESRIANKKNNLFGLNAIDGDAFNKAFSFDTKNDSIQKFGEIIAEKYVEKGYVTIEKLAKKYCPANNAWAKHVKKIMERDFAKV